MKAIAAYQGLPVTDPKCLQDIEMDEPQAKGHDLLVEVKAISVNPVDTKVRMGSFGEPSKEALILGWDASGIVKAVGEDVTLFKPGDKVWYAGVINRNGSNSEYQLVDERIVGRMPESLEFAEAAALPLTTITAWELLFDRLGLRQGEHEGEKLMVIGAAGGVGSILIQLARQLTQITVIATASREKTQKWVRDLGAQEVIDHSKSLSQELLNQNLGEVDYVISLNQTDHHLDEIVASLKPQGKLALIDDPDLFDVRKLKQKSLSLHWELMFTRPLYATEDQIVQHQLLNTVADLVDAGKIRTTLDENYGTINAENLRRAHELLESGKATGKIVLENFS